MIQLNNNKKERERDGQQGKHSSVLLGTSMHSRHPVGRLAEPHEAESVKTSRAAGPTPRPADIYYFHNKLLGAEEPENSEQRKSCPTAFQVSGGAEFFIFIFLPQLSTWGQCALHSKGGAKNGATQRLLNTRDGRRGKRAGIRQGTRKE